LYVRLTIPRLFGAPLRLEIRPSYTSESTDYFGMGNASSRQAADDNPNPDYSKYHRGHPQFDVDVRARLIDHLALRMGFRYIYNAIRRRNRFTPSRNPPNCTAAIPGVAPATGTKLPQRKSSFDLRGTGLIWACSEMSTISSELYATKS
jgi:hypothetical protein